MLQSSGPRRLSAQFLALVVATGGVAALALTCYLLAARLQLVTIAVVFWSLSPVVPVLLGISLLHEELIPGQLIGLFAAGTAVGLATVG